MAVPKVWLVIRIVASDHILLLSNEMLFELAKVLRYPHMLELHGISEERIYDYVAFLREAAEIVVPNPLLIAPIRDINDTVVMQTALIGEADVLRTRDRDFFEPPAEAFLRKAGIAVMDDVALIQRLRS
jgi:putative PIN family toxin of toxin-antitoxin system